MNISKNKKCVFFLCPKDYSKVSQHPVHIFYMIVAWHCIYLLFFSSPKKKKSSPMLEYWWLVVNSVSGQLPKQIHLCVRCVLYGVPSKSARPTVTHTEVEEHVSGVGGLCLYQCFIIATSCLVKQRLVACMPASLSAYFATCLLAYLLASLPVCFATYLLRYLLVSRPSCFATCLLHYLSA